MRLHHLLALSFLVTTAAACGDDEPPPPGAPGAPKPGAPAAKPKGKAPPQFAARVRIEDRVLDPEEKKGIRHQFKERDFIVDQSNRDPFQSFVLNQGLVGPGDKPTLELTPKCKPDGLVATNYSYTDLRLVGIVAQGTQRKVLMMDAGNLGHIIKRGDCVGREKALVKDIGTGYITFQLEADQTGMAGTGVQRAPEERSVQLYPNQMPITSQPTLDNEAAKTQTPDVAPPTTAPQRAPQPDRAPPPAPAPDKSSAPN